MLEGIDCSRRSQAVHAKILDIARGMRRLSEHVFPGASVPHESFCFQEDTRYIARKIVSSIDWMRLWKTPGAAKNFGTRSIQSHGVVPAGDNGQAIGHLPIAATELHRN